MKIKLVDHAILIVLLLGLFNCKSTSIGLKDSDSKTMSKSEDGYLNLYNGKNMGNWNIICRSTEEGLAERVFSAGENGEMHVFKNFPNEYGFTSNKSDTHCMFFTKEKYSRYSFKFEYKWGEKIFNNFEQFQYDAGLYFHVFDVGIWPKGLEYQVRYDHIKNENHTGCVWNSGSGFDWYADSTTAVEPKMRSYLSKGDGGRLQAHRQGEHKAHRAAPFHGLDGQWNECEVIVMGNKYAVYKLNGVVVNVLTNLKNSEGEIGMQAETAEIYYRNIKIKEFEVDLPIENFVD